MCFLMSWTSFHKHDRTNWMYVTMHVGNYFSFTIFHTSGNALSSIWFLIWIVACIYLAVSCLWNEVQHIRKHMQKSTKSSKSSLFHFLERGTRYCWAWHKQSYQTNKWTMFLETEASLPWCNWSIKIARIIWFGSRRFDMSSICN